MQTEATASLVSELEEYLGPWRARLAPQLSPVLERHHQNLMALVHSLERAGHGPNVIRSSLRALLASYEADLTAALQNGGMTS